MTNNEIIIEIINRKDDTEFMDMISNITFPFTNKYKSYRDIKEPVEKKVEKNPFNFEDSDE